MQLSKKRILLAFGTRPEAIKMAPLYHALRAQADCFDTQVCVTGQHRQMLDQVLNVFDIKPDIDLDVMKPGQDLFDITSSVLLEMREVLREHRPDVLLVHGDTTTTLAAAMAGFYAGIPVGHVEAGLRTFDLQAPFPEEFNRQVVSRVAQWHFAPTAASRANLLAEQVPESRISVTGNTVIDALFWVLERIEGDADRRQEMTSRLNRILGFNWQTERYILITGHRRENFGDGLAQICAALHELAQGYPGIHFVYPMHLNPHVRQQVQGMLDRLPNIHLTEPLDYEVFVYLLKHAHVVLTDSGGIQEEAPSLGKPVLVTRAVTERPEAIAAGTAQLVGTQRDQIVRHVASFLDDPAAKAAIAKTPNPYGDGLACQRIIAFLKENA